jgi:hypothetical protein
MLTGDILMGAVYGDRVHEMEGDKKIRTAFRMLERSIPQVIGCSAMFVIGLERDCEIRRNIYSVKLCTVCPVLLVLTT